MATSGGWGGSGGVLLWLLSRYQWLSSRSCTIDHPLHVRLTNQVHPLQRALAGICDCSSFNCNIPYAYVRGNGCNNVRCCNDDRLETTNNLNGEMSSVRQGFLRREALFTWSKGTNTATFQSHAQPLRQASDKVQHITSIY